MLETAWLIERREPNPEYLYVVDWFAFHWTNDSSKAIRFARRQDAEQMLKMTETEVCFAVEHEWGLAENETLPNCIRCHESKPTVFVPTGFSGEHELLCGPCVGIMLGEAYDLMEKARIVPLTGEMIIKCDGRTGSTHMTDREQWGALMAQQLNDNLIRQASNSPTNG